MSATYSQTGSITYKFENSYEAFLIEGRYNADTYSPTIKSTSASGSILLKGMPVTSEYKSCSFVADSGNQIITSITAGANTSKQCNLYIDKIIGFKR